MQRQDISNFNNSSITKPLQPILKKAESKKDGLAKKKTVSWQSKDELEMVQTIPNRDQLQPKDMTRIRRFTRTAQNKNKSSAPMETIKYTSSPYMVNKTNPFSRKNSNISKISNEQNEKKEAWKLTDSKASKKLVEKHRDNVNSVLLSHFKKAISLNSHYRKLLGEIENVLLWPLYRNGILNHDNLGDIGKMAIDCIALPEKTKIFCGLFQSKGKIQLNKDMVEKVLRSPHLYTSSSSDLSPCARDLG